MTGMEIQVLHIDDCPNWQQAVTLVESALQQLGRGDVPVVPVRITDTATAVERHFAGSPTIMVNGSDLFPIDGATNDLACRIYQTPDGLRGLPTEDQILVALTRVGAKFECSCCGRLYERRQLHGLGNEFICRRCGLWVAMRLRRDHPS
jgi:predicted RNA-binding Zn-ribbon protein involved in translation (DUF1610 family)